MPRKTVQPPNCAVCLKTLEFSPRGRPRLTCSRKCRDAKKLAELKAGRQTQKICVTCEKPFSTGKKDQRFCSAKCRHTQYKVERPYQPKTQPKLIICGWCGVGLLVPPSFTGATKYHDECRVQARRARYRIKTVKRQSRTVKPSRLSADELVLQKGSDCGICNNPIDMNVSRTSKMGLTVDHIIPLSKGGADTLDNMQPAHWICNVRKGNKTNA